MSRLQSSIDHIVPVLAYGMPCEEFHTFKSFPSSKREEIIQEGIELLQRQGKPNLSAVK
jgi:hypothetical protein